MMKKILLVVLLFMACACAAVAENFTLTTYYPVPNGRYMNLSVMNNLGIGTTAPQAALELAEGAILATGTLGSGWGEPNLGAGTRLLWYPRKAAFRAGQVNAAQWNDANIGSASIAFGSNTIASGPNSAAFGSGTTTSGFQSTAFGNGTTANNTNATAFGNQTHATGVTSTTFGGGTTASGSGSTAFGSWTTASGFASTAFGANTTASGFQSTAFGSGTTASGHNSTAFGVNTTAQPWASMAIGQYNIISGNPNTWVASDPAFVIGNGTDSANPSNALTVLKNGNVGINVAAPRTALEIGGGDGAILARGTFGSGWTEPNLGAGTRLMWYPRKAAFRAGRVTGAKWNDASIGIYSVALGNNSMASGDSSFVGGGNSNTANSFTSFVGGGSNNTASNTSSVIGGGQNNTASGTTSFVGGGGSNRATATSSSVCGGNSNTASLDGSFVGGGMSNTASGGLSFVGGGDTNTASGGYSFIGGGQFNTASGLDSTVIGARNIASGNYSFTGGQNMRSSGKNTFVWGHSGAPVNIATPDAFIIYSGNVGINTTAPAYALDVNGSANMSTLNTNTLTINAGPTFSRRLGAPLGVELDSNFYIGPAFEMYAKKFNEVSDERLKQDITPVTHALDKVKAMNGVYFKFKADPSRVHVGLIAQNVEKAVPEVVSADGEGMKSVAYSNLVAVLIEAVKEQQLVVDQQQLMINELRKKVDALMPKSP